ncbi:radical SAM protein [Candidatus Woesearchaeota archaeon]|nr:radical SAM protein [Candidatus Woesearchaeota archaeon]
MNLQLIHKGREQLKPSLINVTKESEIPLIGAIAFGIIDRGTNLLQVRCTSVCNMLCGFCSTAANSFDIHPVNYIVDIDYLIQEIKKIIAFKGNDIHIFLDSVGDPLTHPKFSDLVSKLRKISNISKIDVITNGSLLNKKLVDSLEIAGLNRLNVSVHSLESLKAKMLFGSQNYNIEKVKEMLNYIKDTKIDLWLTPVWIPNINDNDIKELIKFAKENSFNIAIQKYETYQYSRKMKKAKKINYWKFYKQLQDWEKEFGIKLKFTEEDPTIIRRKSLPLVFDINEKIQGIVVCKGWFEDQVIAKAKDRCINVNKCNSKIGDKINLKIVENSNNIYIADLIRK